MLAHGQGRSYGDCCLNDGGKLLRTEGLIAWAEVERRGVPGAAVRMAAIPVAGLDEFVALSDESDAGYEYTVAWLDVLSRAQRGIFFRGDHVAGAVRAPRTRTAVPTD